MSERDFKIELINGYRKLLELVLKPVTKDANVQSQIQADFQAFVNDQLNNLMGNDSDKEDSLSQEEISFLKSFIDRAKNKPTEGLSKPLNKNAGTTEVKEKDSKKDPNPPAYRPANLQPPLGNKNTAKAEKHANQDVLSRLDEMDKKFENEW